MLCLIAVLTIYGQVGTVQTTSRQISLKNRIAVCETVVEEAERQDIDSSLAIAVALEESSLTEGKPSEAGAIGTMQILPKYWCKSRKECDPIEAGVRALKYYVNTSDTYKQAVRKYAGAGERARLYSKRVMLTYTHLENVLDSI